jgi:hypothetical protein
MSFVHFMLLMAIFWRLGALDTRFAVAERAVNSALSALCALAAILVYFFSWFSGAAP